MFLDLVMKYRSSVPSEAERRREKIVLARKEVLRNLDKVLVG